jgi:hypothetical protein
LTCIDQAEELDKKNQQLEEKNRELNNLVAMFAHNFLGTLQCIRSNAEHDNNPTIHLKTVKMMGGALTAFSILSADDDKLVEQLKQDNTGEMNLQQNLANNLALAISQLLGKTNKDKIVNLYLQHLSKTKQIETETTSEELRINRDYRKMWQALQHQWEDDFNALFSENVDLPLLQKWIAGYQIYTELVIELGFPKAHILFCSNHASYFNELKGKFASANIKLPLSSNPDKPFLTKDDAADIKQWLNDAQHDYFVLRRGIIEGCRHISTNMSEDKLRFKDFINETVKKVSIEDLHDYVKVLENFLPLREPSDTHKAVLYKLFVRTLSHEWEAAEPKQLNKQNKQNGLYAFSWIMKMSRNWLAHGKVFEQLTAPDLAYLFIVNMRAMYDLGDKLLPYEKRLLGLFSKVISMDEMKEVIGSYHGNRKIPLIQSYAALLHT